MEAKKRTRTISVFIRAGLSLSVLASSVLASRLAWSIGNESGFACWVSDPDSESPASIETWCFGGRSLSSSSGESWLLGDDGLWRSAKGGTIANRVLLARAGAPTHVLQSVSMFRESIQPDLLQVERAGSEAAQADRFSTARPTTERVTVPTSRRPWEGYWWSYSGGRMHTGPDSPLAAWDKLMAARGRSSSAQSWEATNRPPQQAVSWAGHCNGWAAASQLFEEPRAPLTDRQSGVTLSVSQQKGILSSTSFCVRSAFYGRRYRGPQDSLLDLEPALFHSVLIEYIKNQGRPIGIDVDRGDVVSNKVVVAYDTNVGTPNADGWISVTTSLELGSYSSSPSDTPGSAPTMTETYQYELRWDDRVSDVVESRWISANPDFLWAPLANVDCGRENPHVRAAWVRELWAPRSWESGPFNPRDSDQVANAADRQETQHAQGGARRTR